MILFKADEGFLFNSIQKIYVGYQMISLKPLSGTINNPPYEPFAITNHSSSKWNSLSLKARNPTEKSTLVKHEELRRFLVV